MESADPEMRADDDVSEETGGAHGRGGQVTKFPLPSVLRRARLRCLLTQRQLARRLDVHPRAVYRWEAGVCVPRRRRLLALIAALTQSDPHVAGQLRAQLASAGLVPPAPGTAATSASGVVPVGRPACDSTSYELALLELAEEFDVSPRRVRQGVERFLQRLGLSPPARPTVPPSPKSPTP